MLTTSVCFKEVAILKKKVPYAETINLRVIFTRKCSPVWPVRTPMGLSLITPLPFAKQSDLKVIRAAHISPSIYLETEAEACVDKLQAE